MAIEIGMASKKDHKTVFHAVFGSYEQYIQSPGYKECKDRISYLATLKANAALSLDDEYQKLRWWKLYNHAEFFIGKKFLFPLLYKRIDQLINRYSRIMAFPIGPAVAFQRRHFDEFMKDWKKVIIIINKQQNVKDDPYVSPY